MSYQEMALDVLQTLDSQEIHSKVVLIGHSMGGKVAQMLALMHPERIAGVVVLDIAPVDYWQKPQEQHWNTVETIIHAIHRVAGDTSLVSKRDIQVSLQPTIPDPALLAFVMTNYDTTKKQWKINIESIVDQLQNLAGFDVSPDRQYHGDVFFVHGGQSRYVRHAHIEQIASFFPNHMLTTIRGVGHW
eukprot:CAMPEP_0118680108 /NCGR_PEP_ID=MMETSP0800-20121206/4168_1 /TAXON_ID=210618 ORGANISM="Striatella unipunctata, Strain CCMP2910" /NCGR_SAMPLE_ID=MMETSP0800 /ASSEMBLY_ACC=CAM_ASM_000638 /LENGTH=187 /DNA_ID=CAMNT_0006576193 /DNA_START=76 /DNA_END=636 /DNA_ORIENTATION=+